jgi:hypothetical protein
LTFDGTYARFEPEIAFECARRIVIDIARSASRINLNELVRLCALPSIDHLVEGLKEHDGLVLTVNRQIVSFKRPSVTAKIIEEIAAVQRRGTI